MPYLGEILSLLTAVVWGIAVICFKKSGEGVHPMALNIFKNGVAIVLFVPTIYLLNQTMPDNTPWSDVGLLLLSGFIGIALADTLFFHTLNMLGAGLTAIVDCAYAPLVVLLSVLFLGESLSVLQIVGISLIVSGVAAPTLEQEDRSRPDLTRRRLITGVAIGLTSMLGMAVGIVMVKRQVEIYPVVWTAQIRMIGGFVGLAVMLLFKKDRGPILRSLASGPSRKWAIGGALLGGYLSMMLWLAGMKFAQASISAAINQTSNLFVFIFAWLLLKERLTWPRTLGIILGLAGVLLASGGGH